MRPNRKAAQQADDDAWVSTSRSTFTNHWRASMTPPRRDAPDALHDHQRDTDLQRAWHDAISPEEQRFREEQRYGDGAYGGGAAYRVEPYYDENYAAAALRQPPQQYDNNRAINYLAAADTNNKQSNTAAFSSIYNPQGRRTRRSAQSRCHEDHIVFENTRYEDPVDPGFYAAHRDETDGSPPAYDGEEEGFIDWSGFVERNGFPGKRHTVARRRFVTGSAQEKTHDLFTRNVFVPPPGMSITQLRLGQGSRRHLSPTGQSMSNTFQAVGAEVPFFHGGKKVTSDRLAGDYDRTQRVLRTELQEPPPPLRTHVRVGMGRPDEMAPTYDGTTLPQKNTRRRFFEMRE